MIPSAITQAPHRLWHDFVVKVEAAVIKASSCKTCDTVATQASNTRLLRLVLSALRHRFLHWLYEIILDTRIDQSAEKTCQEPDSTHLPSHTRVCVHYRTSRGRQAAGMLARLCLGCTSLCVFNPASMSASCVFENGEYGLKFPCI